MPTIFKQRKPDQFRLFLRLKGMHWPRISPDFQGSKLERKFSQISKISQIKRIEIKGDLMSGYHVLECFTGKLRDIEDTFHQIDVQRMIDG